MGFQNTVKFVIHLHIFSQIPRQILKTPEIPFYPCIDPNSSDEELWPVTLYSVKQGNNIRHYGAHQNDKTYFNAPGAFHKLFEKFC